jgi:hypothetical protein
MSKFKITIAMALALAIALFSNCTPQYILHVSPEFIVKDKTPDKKTGFSEYDLRPRHGRGYVSLTDTSSAFIVSDTLVFKKK